MLNPIPYGHEIRPSNCGGCGTPINKPCRRGPSRACKREFFGGTREAITAPAPTADEINRLIKAATELTDVLKDDGKDLVDVSAAMHAVAKVIEGKV